MNTQLLKRFDDLGLLDHRMLQEVLAAAIHGGLDGPKDSCRTELRVSLFGLWAQQMLPGRDVTLSSIANQSADKGCMIRGTGDTESVRAVPLRLLSQFDYPEDLVQDIENYGARITYARLLEAGFQYYSKEGEGFDSASRLTQQSPLGAELNLRRVYLVLCWQEWEPGIRVVSST
jgi:hypothetical protein